MPKHNGQNKTNLYGQYLLKVFVTWIPHGHNATKYRSIAIELYNTLGAIRAIMWCIKRYSGNNINEIGT